MIDQPQIKDAPGLGWRQRKSGWIARWYGRPDIIAKGYPIKTVRLWQGEWPTTADADKIITTCQKLQDEMLAWSYGLPVAVVKPFDGTLGGVIDAYLTDPDSDYHKNRHTTKVNYNSLIKIIRETSWTNPQGNTILIKDEDLKNINARAFLRWYEHWRGDGKIAMARYLMTVLRIVFSFGAKFLDDAGAKECARIREVLHSMRFKATRPRDSILTAAQATAIRRAAHEAGRPRLALAQAIQFDCTLRQKDVIGEWVPISEPEFSTVTRAAVKWIRGLKWEEITQTADGRIILKHMTSKRQKVIEVDLTKAPMVMEELAIQYPNGLPSTGPVIEDDITGAPFIAMTFRVAWRKLARSVGIPDTVRNMDSRAGAITEALVATGGDLDAVRISATHSNVQTTMGYSRGNAERIGAVMDKRAKHRKNT